MRCRLHAHSIAARARDGPFKALFANTYFWRELIHMYLAGYIVSGFILASCVSAIVPTALDEPSSVP
jgi:cytochrome bd-type quinol oxidase subunit 1